MHVASVLPPELFDESIDHLWDDPKSLAACALTCRDWIGTSRLHLFRTVRIQNASQCARFEALLQSTPAIARCVRRFTVSAEYKGVDEAGRSVEDDAWVNAVGGFVHRLERVTTIGLSRVRWHALLPETQAAFVDRFAHVRTLFLFEVRFEASRDVLDFLGAFPALNELYFHGVAWNKESPAPLGAPADETAIQAIRQAKECMHLSYLFLDSRSSPTLVTEWLLSHPSEQHLRTIQLCWREIENMKVVGDLLHASGASLERLLVEFPSGVPEEAVLDNQISLVHNTGLRSVRFGGLDAKAAASQGFMSNQLFPWVTAMISQISSPQLEEISFEFEITSVADLLSLDWSRIDHDLSREEYKGLLVYFFVVCQDMTPKVEKEIRNLIADRLHGLCERGTLCVSCV
ncbi:uncharacterized protein C8Q71DRAFT_243006 [Rhodofomes roseus]|uniref:F-box domain-containing protein n=1 Tax=Rhodofomes roseus TaxID=34475 RepID=A0ABQ8K6V8_9APHY|nr:uncharacterized protein C8Q71DRAFT_243006 [Rhodofomes roseus]KAH9832892.1 hypothetical protein C8Q71DRAFT_243006 [Rhodofomes roseus]